MQEIVLAVVFSVSPVDMPSQDGLAKGDGQADSVVIQVELELLVSQYEGVNRRYRELLKKRESARLHMNLQEDGAEAKFRLLDKDAQTYRNQLLYMEEQLKALNTRRLSWKENNDPRKDCVWRHY